MSQRDLSLSLLTLLIKEKQVLTTRMSDQSRASPHAEKAENMQEGSPVASNSPQPAMDDATEEQQEEKPAQQEDDNPQQTPQSQ